MATTASSLLRLFVYGTLKRGGAFHDRMCRGVVSIEEATTCGRLGRVPAGYPTLLVAPEIVLAEGTADPLDDVATQVRLDAEADARQLDGELVRGEVLTFDDPATRLRVLDDFEDFQPGGTSLYRRVLLPVVLEGSRTTIAAWAYIAPNNARRAATLAPE